MWRFRFQKGVSCLQAHTPTDGDGFLRFSLHLLHLLCLTASFVPDCIYCALLRRLHLFASSCTFYVPEVPTSPLMRWFTCSQRCPPLSPAPSTPQMSEKMELSEKQAEEGLVDEAQALLAEVRED